MLLNYALRVLYMVWNMSSVKHVIDFPQGSQRFSQSSRWKKPPWRGYTKLCGLLHGKSTFRKALCSQ